MSAGFAQSKLAKIEKEQVKDDLRKIGVTKGSHLLVALSMKSIGLVKGGPNALIDALLETVGSEGTIMMNAFTSIFPVSRIPSDYVFDRFSTVPNTGLVPREFVKREETVRSRHPHLSVAAAGKFAEYLTADHDERSGPYLPYQRLAQIDGKCLFIGIGDRLVGIRHEAQRRAGLWIVPMYFGVQYSDSTGTCKLFVQALPPCVKRAPQLVPSFERMGIIERGKIGNALSIIASARELIDAMVKVLKSDPTLNLCDDIFCLQCRELERRMKLYKRIVNPRLFQRNLLIRKVIALRNRLVLSKYSYVSYRDSFRPERIGIRNFLEYPFPRIVRLVNFIFDR
jgi:aminoglycoside 3-N-acetyltransferase